MALLGTQMRRFCVGTAMLEDLPFSRVCLHVSLNTLRPFSSLSAVLASSSKLLALTLFSAYLSYGLKPMWNLAIFLASVDTSSPAYRASRLNSL